MTMAIRYESSPWCRSTYSPTALSPATRWPFFSMAVASARRPCRHWRAKRISLKLPSFFPEMPLQKRNARSPRPHLHCAGRTPFRRTSHARHRFRSARPDRTRPKSCLDLNVGTVPVRFTQPPGQPIFGEMTQKQPAVRRDPQRRADIARLTGLSAADFDDSAPIQTVSTGMPFTIVAAAFAENAARISASILTVAAEYLARSGGKFFYFVCRETVDPKARLHARMIFYNGDDPATGSAAGCCAAWMVAHGVAASDEQVLIEQGLEMHRPSSIFVRATKRIDRWITMSSMCVSVEIVWKFSAAKSRSRSRSETLATVAASARWHDLAFHRSAIGEHGTLPAQDSI